MVQETPRNVLYIEDDVGLGRLLQKRLQLKNFHVTIAETGQEGIEQINKNIFDLILLDNFLPDMTGIDILAHLHPLDSQPPIILLTANGDERLAVTALEKGAADYAVKDPEQFYIELLPAVMHAAYTRYRLMHENQQQKKDLESAWQKAEAASQAKSEFLATMSHEIRTPLNVISGISALLAHSALDEKQHEMVGVLNSNAAMLLGLVNDILDLSRIEAGRTVLDVAPFTAQHVLDNMKAMFALDAQKKDLVFSVADLTDNRQWMGDVARVQQILMNLIGNAIKFTEQGFVKVVAMNKLQPNGTVNLQICVEDSGIGITKEKIKDIFSKFVQADQSITRRFGGSGLGLALSQSFAELMKGKITVESDVNKGSNFTVDLPLESQQPQHDLHINNDVHPTIGDNDVRNTILLVEDYPANILIATMMLENMDYKVEVVSTGHDAVEKVRHNTEAYHAILMDVQMQGMDGFEATRHIRKLEAEKGIRHTIIGATAHALVGDREKCLEAGMDDYVSKPIDWALVGEKLAAVKSL